MKNSEKFCDTTQTDGAKLTAHVKAGGCAAKIAPAELAEIVQSLPKFVDPQLLTSTDSFEDAAVYKLSDDVALVQTIDFFPPVVDDPYLFGRISAVNALSDVYATGGRPITCLAMLCFPTCDFPLSVAQEILRGGADAVKAAGALLVGGHSIQGPEPIYGLAVTGLIDPKTILTNDGGKDGDALVLTKRIGSGVLLLAHKAGWLDESLRDTLFDSLTLLNKQALEIALPYKPHAATDITGFGLVGHLHNVAQASNLKCTLWINSIPFFPEAARFAETGLVPGGAYANRNAYKKISYIKDGIEESALDLIYDPQTSGGLLFALPEERAQKLVKDLQQAGLTGAIIGTLSAGERGVVEVKVQ